MIVLYMIYREKSSMIQGSSGAKQEIWWWVV